MAMPLADASAAEPALLRQRGSNHVGLRQFNERVVLQALRTHGSLAKAEIARVTGLTAQAIGLIAARLDHGQILRRRAPGRRRGGPLRARVGGVGLAAPLQLGGWHRMLGLSAAQSQAWNSIDLTGQVQQMTGL